MNGRSSPSGPPSSGDGALSVESLIAFLGEPANYEPAPETVEIVQTHISIVALTPTHVFKVKKPVDLGFLDFSTLERRRHYCEEEVRLNRRLCADVYEGVVPLLREVAAADRTDVIRFGRAEEMDAPEVVEYAVRMRRLDPAGFMDRLIEYDGVEPSDLLRVARKLRDFYVDTPATAATSEWGRVERIRISVDENFQQARAHVGRLLSAAALRALELQADRVFASDAMLLEHRRASGWVRDCHGDLHLDHVHVSPDQICIYDCIEFSERLRSIDVASDIAFLAMDLDFNGRPELARTLAGHMTGLLEDPELPLLLPFYKTYRAFVRAKVAGMRSDDVRGTGGAPARRGRGSTPLLQAGSPLRRIIRPTHGGGVDGSGRIRKIDPSADARRDALGWRVASSDETRKRMAGVPLSERGSDAQRRRLYAPEVSARTYEALLEAAREETAAGRGVVLDATFGKRKHRDNLRTALSAHARRLGRPVPYRFIEVQASDEVVKARLEERETRTDVVSDARLEDFDVLSSSYEAPDALEDAYHFPVTSVVDPDETQWRILERLVAFSEPEGA